MTGLIDKYLLIDLHTNQNSHKSIKALQLISMLFARLLEKQDKVFLKYFLESDGWIKIYQITEFVDHYKHLENMQNLIAINFFNIYSLRTDTNLLFSNLSDDPKL